MAVGCAINAVVAAHEAAADDEEPVGLTPASLKHVKRQRDRLEEEKQRLLTETSVLQEQIKDQRVRIGDLEVEVKNLREELAALRPRLAEAEAREEQERTRADRLEQQNASLETSLAAKESEVSRLRQALEDQRLLTKEVCEGAENRAQGSSRELEERCAALLSEKDKLEKDLKRQATEHEELKSKVGGAIATAEKAMEMYKGNVKSVEQVRNAKLADAINQKVELHIAVPRVTLSYNNAPPLSVAIASGLGEHFVRDFLSREVFPQFEPLWVRMDSLDQAPDGSSKKAYATRMLNKLTDAVKGFIHKSQQSDDAPLPNGMTVEEGGARKTSKDSAPSVGRNSTRLPSDASNGELREADRDKLLELLRSGDDRGLDSKLGKLLEGRR
jgi:hypothetical protein